MAGTKNKRRLGILYENRAAEYLRQNGIEVLEQNFRCRQGEVDIIGKEADYLLFIEVKYRSSTAKGYPAEAVTSSKQRTIRQVAQYYLYTKNIPEDVGIRFDVISILQNEIEHIRDAF